LIKKQLHQFAAKKTILNQILSKKEERRTNNQTEKSMTENLRYSLPSSFKRKQRTLKANPDIPISRTRISRFSVASL
jgi:hypothetical protein